MKKQLSNLPFKKVSEVMLLCVAISIIIFINLNYNSHVLNFLKLIHEPSKWVAVVSGLVLLLSVILVIFKSNLKRKHRRMIIKIGIWSGFTMIISLYIMSSYTLIIDPPLQMHLK